jgi:hypothetical protein
MPRPPRIDKNLVSELRDQLEKANETILHLEQLLLLQGGNLYGGLSLTPHQQKVVNMILAANGICTQEKLYAALYDSRHDYQPDPKILREMLRVIRKQLRPHGIEITTAFGKGYIMPNDSRTKLRELAEKHYKSVHLQSPMLWRRSKINSRAIVTGY